MVFKALEVDVKLLHFSIPSSPPTFQKKKKKIFKGFYEIDSMWPQYNLRW